MNPLTNVRNITKLNERELQLGVDFKNSWHNMYKDSAWVFIGGLNYDMSEGDIITVFSQYGEVVNINLIRDQKSGKSKGFCFLCYEDQRSTVLSVDNLNGIKLLNRTIRCDHVANYKVPKEHEDMDPITKQLHAEGCAPKEMTLPLIGKHEDNKHPVLEININIKKEKKRKRKHKRSSSESSDSSSSSDSKSKRDKSRLKKTSSSKHRRHGKSLSNRSVSRDRNERKESQYRSKYEREKSRSDSKHSYYK